MIADHQQITIQFTPEQQQLIYRLSGYSRPSLSLSTLQAAALSLTAAAAGSQVLPVSDSAATINEMLDLNGHEHQAYLLRLQLTDQQRDLLQGVTKIPLSSIALAPDEWNPTFNETWQQESNEVRFGQGTLILGGSNGDEGTIDDCVTDIPLDGMGSGGVFGTGKHAATQLSLEFLESSVQVGDRVLDVGTGSGILAVAAARLGAIEVIALDTNQAAVAKAGAVVRANDVQNIVTVEHGSVGSAKGVFDVVVANIFTHIILSLAPAFSLLVKSQGKLILSGIVSARADEVVKRLGSAGFEFHDQRSRDVWQALVFTRKAD